MKEKERIEDIRIDKLNRELAEMKEEVNFYKLK